MHKRMLIDLTGKTFGKLKVIKSYGHDNQNALLWLCKCSCGKTTIVRGYQLRENRVKSCGCLHKKYCDSYLSVFFNNNKNNFCNEWLKNRQNFYNYVKTIGYTTGKYINRIDTNLPYQKDNIQICDYPRNFVIVDTAYGKTSLAELSRLSNISLITLRARYARGIRGNDLLYRGNLRNDKI